MSLSVEIREQLTRYLTGQVGLENFREWLAPRAWNIDKRADRLTAEMAHTIEFVLSEFDHGDWSEDEVKELLFPLVIHTQIFISAPSLVQHVLSGTISMPVTVKIRPPTVRQQSAQRTEECRQGGTYAVGDRLQLIERP